MKYNLAVVQENRAGGKLNSVRSEVAKFYYFGNMVVLEEKILN